MKILRLAGTAIAAVGLILGCAGGVFLARSFSQIDNWKAVDARLTGSFPQEHDSPAAVYEFWYQVDGTTFTEKFTSKGATLEEIKDRTARRITGSTYRIFHNPSNPRDINPNLGVNPATLSTGVLLGGSGLILALIGAGLTLLAIGGKTNC